MSNLLGVVVWTNNSMICTWYLASIPLLIFQNCRKFHSPITARDSEITSDNFEISPPIMLLPKSIQIPYNAPVYECTSAFFVHVQGKCCLVSQISRRDHSFMLAWIKAWSGVGGGGGLGFSKGFNKWSSCLQSSIFMKSFTSTYNTVRPTHSLTTNQSMNIEDNLGSS